MLIHQSDLKSFNRCPEQHRRQRAGEEGGQLSATAFGSVMHHALHTYERTGDVELAVNTFAHYWHPHNIDAICRPVDIWIVGQNFSKLRSKGVETIRRYADVVQYRDEEVLALEFPFVVDLPGTLDADTGRPHELAGTIDRLALRKKNSKWNVCVDDWKTGKKATYLHHNIQGSAYCYASTQRQFWVGNPAHHTEGFAHHGEMLYEKFEAMPRRFTWINVMGGPNFDDAGARDMQSYRKFGHAVDQYVKSVRAGIFPLNIEGEVCQYCPFREDCPQPREGIEL